MFVAGNIFACFSQYFVLRQRQQMENLDYFPRNAATLEATIKGFCNNESEVLLLLTFFQESKMTCSPAGNFVSLFRLFLEA